MVVFVVILGGIIFLVGTSFLAVKHGQEQRRRRGGNLARTLLTSALGKDKDSAAGKCILGSLGISDTGGNRKGAGKYLSRGAEEKDKILRELTAATTDMVENTRAGKAA